MQIPGIIEHVSIVHSHSIGLAKMVGPSGQLEFQTKQARVIQAFVKPAVERAVAPNCSLNSLHQRVKLLPILFSNGVFDRYGDRSVIMVRARGEIPLRIERRRIDAGLGGKVD